MKYKIGDLVALDTGQIYKIRSVLKRIVDERKDDFQYLYELETFKVVAESEIKGVQLAFDLAYALNGMPNARP